MTIEFEPPVAPFQLKIEPFETEERFGSFRALIRFRLPHSANSGQFVYEADNIWFSYADFDAFLQQLSMVAQGRSEPACLHDMSDYIALTIASKDERVSLSIRVLEPFDGNATLQASFACDRDFVGIIRDKFRAFPKWW